MKDWKSCGRKKNCEEVGKNKYLNYALARLRDFAHFPAPKLVHFLASTSMMVINLKRIFCNISVILRLISGVVICIYCVYVVLLGFDAVAVVVKMLTG